LFKYKVKKKSAYGEISINLKSKAVSKLFLELITEKGELVKRVFLEEDSNIKFDFLEPSKYKLRVILDENVNNKWDTGNLKKKQQPEKVIYFTKTIEVRANWSISEEFIIE